VLTLAMVPLVAIIGRARSAPAGRPVEAHAME
jgi:hypothetical protein